MATNSKKPLKQLQAKVIQFPEIPKDFSSPSIIANNAACSEAKLCSAFRKWYRDNSQLAPQLGRIFFVPNEGSRDPKFGAILKHKGWREGVSDYIWNLGPNGRALYMEFKRPGQKQSPGQMQFELECRASGAQYSVFYSPQEAAVYCSILLFSERFIEQDAFNKLIQSARAMCRDLA